MRDSNVSVENYFNIVKHIVLLKKLNIPARRFLRKIEEKIDGWLRERSFLLITERQRNSRKRKQIQDDENLSIETFKPELIKRRRSNIYYTQNKHINSINPTLTRKQPKNYTESRSRTENGSTIKNERCTETFEEGSTGINISGAITLSSPILADEVQWTDNNIIAIEDNETVNTEDAEDYTSFIADIRQRFFRKSLTYFPNFPNHKKSIGGIQLNSELFSRLQPDASLDGELINAFFVSLQEISIKNGWKALMFDTYFTEKMMAGDKSVGFSKWVKKVQPWSYDLWLLPVLVNNNHWTLLVVILRQRLMIYFDSCHKLPPQLVIDRICSFISSSRTARHDKLTQWSKWVLSAPIDIPEQKDEHGRITDNCGVHVCMWAYAIVSRSIATFNEEDIKTARKGLARFLADFPVIEEKPKAMQINDALITFSDCIPEIKNVFKTMTISRSPPF